MELSGFLKTLDSESPSGVDLRNEAAFHAIERQLEPAARSARKSDHPNEPPTAANVDWAALIEEASALAQTGRDLRLLVIVTRALANTDGYAGLAEGLRLLTQTVEQFWDSLHPELRDKDKPKDAALRRSNALKQLENDDNGLLGDLEMNPVMQLRGIGLITGQNLVDAARTEFEAMSEAPSGLSAAEKETIRAGHETNQARVVAGCRAMAGEDPDAAAALQSDVAAALTEMNVLCAAYSKAAGLENGTGLIFPELEQFLTRARDVMEAHMTATDDAPADDTAPGAAAMATPDAAAPAPRAAGAGVNSREDVMASLTQIIDFYNRTEPSSPIPHLAERMRRMVPMNFMELMEEIAPSGMKEFRNAAGVGNEKAK